MDVSPLAKLDFKQEDKENKQQEAPVVVDLHLEKASAEVVKEVEPVATATIKPSEADEPILKENPHRFVLFPIKYHEVCAENASSAKYFLAITKLIRVNLGVANVQEGRSIVLDCGGN